ncbi:hypothetical protein UFOVP181_328 [uncultured Caudovirales phage]|uniref:YHYH domain-containing protein n=1 Tax=uncultured Caudovirales phage TaxID=2100421 RepID=A0A6J5L0K2_9CAUD|nr:hypothetical protein UFOVP57_311 [uncultured Caudovirales phage]CAB5209128.1 hypothetical protein UFOVP181_328 [uncultured Caudovirales phage]
MADSIDPNANGGKSSNFLPKFFQSDSNKKFLQATVDQLVQPGTVNKINGYIGKENAKASTGADIFIAAATSARQNYQLEPGLVVNDSLGNNTFFKDYQDYINQLSVFGGNTANHARINKQEFYSWDPHIDWDKFVNFQNYYWLPYGPDVITIAGQQENIVSEYRVTIESEGDNNTYLFWPDGLTRNPTLKLYRGQTYKFNITSPGNPFSIKTVRSVGTLNRYEPPGLDGFAVESGTITLTIPFNCPDVLYYVSETDIDLGGVFQILSIDDNTAINVETDLLGKQHYTLSNGTPLSNGMKVRFVGNVTPAEYASGYFYVEGVGTSITLIDEKILELVSSYTISESILFESTPFDSMPFSDATAFAGTRDYIVVNRGSIDHNPWSRYNRWFHKDTIEASAVYNGKTLSLDQTARAVRPIIEFEANLKLFNFGTHAIADVDLIDTYTTDVFSNIEGQLGYNVDGIDLAQGQRVLFTADPDKFVKNNVYRVTFVTIQGVRQIHLELESTPVNGNVVLVKQGVINQGSMYWFNGSAWQVAQQKTTLNQAPLFDVFDDNQISYSDTSTYDGSTFKGTKLFSYKVGSGTVDSNLGFALSYKNINNIGDIVFNFNLASDSFQYKELTDVIVKKIDVGYLYKTLSNNVASYVNGWQLCTTPTTQAALRIYKNSNKVNNFDLDIFDDKTDLADLVVKLYVNGIRLDSSKWALVDNVAYKTVVLATDITVDDVLTIRAFAAQPINSNGYYEIPVNLQNNPLNGSIGDFTLGEVIDHVGSIVDNTFAFAGTYPGAGNLRDLGNVTQYGTKFVQHSGPVSLSLYHTTSETNNVVRAIETARNEYNKFKRNFVTIAETLGVDTDTVTLVDLVLEKINKDKPTTAPYYFSDMVPYGASIKTTLSVVDYRIKTYPLSAVFNLDTLSTKAVGIYLNGTQLLAGRDYTFSDQGFVVISATLANDDTIVIYEYENTNGSFVPETPTKLGIWPKFTPQIYTDTSLVTPRVMIQGHDGSQVLAYGDYRDDLILEVEKRIYNNIKVKYDPSIFDINDFIPSYNRTTDYSLEEFNTTLAPSFYKWATLIDRDFTKPLSYDRTNSFTYDYHGYTAPDGRNVPGYWRGIYRWLLDTDRPNICPWEMLGYSEEPSWWTESYGPAPYTSDNLVMWEDLANGIVREPNKPLVILDQFKRTYLHKHIPVDGQGALVSPLISGLVSGTIIYPTPGDSVFGDVSPIEATWRRSSHYSFSVLLTAMILQPAKTFGILLDRSRIVRNLAGQLIYKDTGLRISPSDIKLPSIYSSTTKVQTAGIINYIVDYILSDNLKSYDEYNYNLQNLNVHLSYRVGGFTGKEKFNLLLDSKTPLSTGSVFIPTEDYSIILNSSSPIKKITYSGVIITKLTDGYAVKGYSQTQPYFKYYAWTRTGVAINVGGISESYTTWTAGSQYAAGKIVQYGNKFYRVVTLHTTTTTFEAQHYQALPALPIIGGRDALLRKEWDQTDAITVPYGTKFRTVQEVVDFLVGYGEWLKDQGFIFDDFNNALNVVTNWESSAKEFMFWTTQNWSSGEDKWEDWSAVQSFSYGAIIKYNGDYYRAIRNIDANPVFNEDDYVKLDGLSTVGSSVISLSPAAAKLTFATPLCVVDNIRNPFNGYEIFKVDGTPIEPNFLNNYREDNSISYTPQDTDGIYGATFYLVQKEQVVILNNTTMFNDTIYNLESGYRQERIKVSGYVSTNWYGGFDVPGFIFDQAEIQLWEAWKDYALGDIIKHKEFYYSAKTSLTGAETFNASEWIKLTTAPAPQLLPNWTYKAGQFEDFYSLDSDNFDVDQQKLAQHLVGYQKRQYLENIIKDDVSEFKFYQGMIVEKGTQNVLNKLFDVLSAEGQESLTFYEEWALRVGQYGASSAFENIELILDEAEFKNNPQGFEFVNVVDETKIDFISRKTPADIYIKPLGYNNKPWPLISDYSSFLRTPGYVRSSEVLYTLKTLDNINDTYVDSTGNVQQLYPITSFYEGAYVWVGFEGPSWNVYRYTQTAILSENIVSVTYSDNDETITIVVDSTLPSQLINNSYIGITGVTEFSGFFKITVLNSTSFLISKTIPAGLSGFIAPSTLAIFSLQTQRAATIDDAYSSLPATLKAGELLWTDNDGTNKWATWEYNPVYSSLELVNTSPSDGLAYGRQIILNADGTVAVVSNSMGEMIVFDKASPNANWIQRETITPPFVSYDAFNLNSQDFKTGDVLAISADSRWFATGTPTASDVTSAYAGEWAPLTGYLIDDIVTHNSKAWICLLSHTSSGAFDNTRWKQIPYIPTNADASNSGLNEQGVISIYEKDKNNIFTLVDTILSPMPADYENFGQTLVFGNNTLFVGATGSDDNTGAVYQLNYSTIIAASTYYNPIGSSNTTIKVASTTDIEVGMAIVGTGFTSGQTVVEVSDLTTLILSATPDSDPAGLVSFTTTGWRYAADFTLNTPYLVGIGGRFGTTMAMSKDSSTLAITAAGINYVFIYTSEDGITYTDNLAASVNGTDGTGFGTALAISNTGTYLAVSATLESGSPATGVVTIYHRNNSNIYTSYETITSRTSTDPIQFGSKISFMDDYKTLVVYSQTDIGQIDVYDRYGSTWLYSETLLNTNPDTAGYGFGLAVGSNTIFVGAPTAVDQTYSSGKVYEYRKLNGAYSWAIIHSEIEKPDVTKIKQAFLYNKETNKIVTYLDVLDSTQGKIPGIADQEIKYKTFFDPAVYSVGNDSVNVDDGMAWTETQTGMLWWDLRTAKFLDSHDDDVVYRNSVWNTLFPAASIDVYEWVSSKYLPSEWDALADTEEGLAVNISGLSLYSDTAYSIVRKYDTVAKTFRNTYYYWVKNKKTIPSISTRNMSSQDVANLISNPRGEGYKYLALTSINSFSLVNVKPSLQDTNVVLSVEYWTIDNTDRNIHTQWKLVSNNVDTSLPAAIEQKWFDSLCGKDSQGRLVPDTTLPVKLQYGVENRPRQSMFINRFEALKQLLEQANRVLIKEAIVEQRDISGLDSYEASPSVITGLYDTVVGTEGELSFAGAGIFLAPSITPVIVDGRITGIEIATKGNGYLVAPYIEVVGTGVGAKIRAKINNYGQIIGATIINSGYGYDSNTVLMVRNYSALVQNDSVASGVWSIYSYEPTTQVWSRVQSQSYDTRKYWSYVDWFATGYNQFTASDFAINTLADINSLTVSVGQLVKVLTDNNGNWMLLEKYAESLSVDWTQSYKVVGLQNGTIQFNPTLYQFTGTSYGYDGALYDGGIFDNSAAIELRNILTALKNNIFIDTLRMEYLNLFFTCVRYALSEQTYLDWIFKTSFVKVQHNVGELKQKVTYNNDNLSNFEDYVAEVKPYRTKIREYISNYSKLDTNSLSITDFDLPPAYDNGKLSPVNAAVVNGKIESDNNTITTYPWKHWLDNVGFTVTEIKLVDGGSGYVTEPVVRFTSNSGTGASARAFISNGKVNRLILITAGSGYLSAPTVVIDGGLSATGTAATAVAIIGNGVVRSNLIKMKFDRITQSYFISQLQETETLTSLVSGSRLQFPLTWAPNIRIGQSSVLINGVDALRDTYKLSIVKSTSRGYTSYSGSIIFDTAPALGSTLTVTYLKDWSLLNAADRIQYYYNPESGMLGKDLSQLMTGVDYGGVIVNGLGFDVSAGWDSLPYYSDKWDSFDSTFNDFIYKANAGTFDSTFDWTVNGQQYISVAGTEINVYYSQLDVTTFPSDGVTTEYAFNVYDIFPPTVVITKEVSISDSPHNVIGSDILTVEDTSSVSIGDVLTITPYVSNTVGYNTVVVNILNGTDVQLDQILYSDVPSGSVATFTKVLSIPADCTISSNAIVTLVTPPPATSLTTTVTITISAYLTPVRLDAADFDPTSTLDYPYGHSPTNEYAIMLPVVADGVSSIVTIPSWFPVNTGDKFFIREHTSDGSISPQDADYDTALSGGEFEGNYATGSFLSATGLRAEDIIIDGDGFVTPTSSPAPEEVVPGQVVDAVAIKVYDRPSSGAATVKVDSYIADGITDIFKISQQPNTPQAIIVKTTTGERDPVTNELLSVAHVETADVDYTVDYRNREIVFNTAPNAGYLVSIFSIGFNGNNLLDLDYFVGDGSTTEFITKAPWLKELSSVVYVDGVIPPVGTPQLFRTDSTYESANRVGIRFGEAPELGALINFIIVSGTDQTFAITKTERIATDGSDTYALSNIIGDSLPIESNMIVRVDQTILEAPNNSYFAIKSNKYNYTIDPAKFLPYSVSITDIVVLANGKLLNPGVDYNVDMGGITVKLTQTTSAKYAGKQLIISVKLGEGYLYIPPTGTTGPQIKFSQPYNNTHLVEVISSYKHDILDIQRTAVNVTSNLTLVPDTSEFYNYVGLSGGYLQLDRTVIDDNYIWVVKNGTLLTPSADFKLNPDKQSITLALLPATSDVFTFITFGSNALTSGIAYMQFKDMLNRTHFKRLNLNKQTTLVYDLRQTDTTITVVDASNFDIPSPANNRPGIVEIRGERIEYFSLVGNVLGQLRRGTLGTGTPTIHRAGSFVQDIGSSETIPYIETPVVETVISNGTNTVNLKFTPGGFNTNWTYAGRTMTANDVTELAKDSIEIFAAGTRLKKNAYSLYDVSIAPESPEGDVAFDKEFTVDGVQNQVQLTNSDMAPLGTTILVIKRQGNAWDSTVNIQYDTSKIARFLKAEPGIWYTELKKS